MSDDAQRVREVVERWWDDTFARPQNPRTIRDDAIEVLVGDLMDLKYEAPLTADPWNLRGRQPMTPVRKER